MEKKALGKGLEALLPTVHFKEPIPQHADVQEVPLSQIIPNRYQPRTTFSEREISELSESIKKKWAHPTDHGEAKGRRHL